MSLRQEPPLLPPLPARRLPALAVCFCSSAWPSAWPPPSPLPILPTWLTPLPTPPTHTLPYPGAWVKVACTPSPAWSWGGSFPGGPPRCQRTRSHVHAGGRGDRTPTPKPEARPVVALERQGATGGVGAGGSSKVRPGEDMAAMGRDCGGQDGGGGGELPVRPRQRCRPQPCDPGHTCTLVTCWCPGGGQSPLWPLGFPRGRA